MTKKIFKFKLFDGGMRHPVVKLLKGFKILKIGSLPESGTFDIIYIWAEVNPNADDEFVKFDVYGTGEEIDTDTEAEYIDSTIQPSSGDVFHVYKRK